MPNGFTSSLSQVKIKSIYYSNRKQLKRVIVENYKNTKELCGPLVRSAWYGTRSAKAVPRATVPSILGTPHAYVVVDFRMVCYGMVWYGMVWYGMVWYGMVWYGMVWYGMVWYGMIWYGMVWYGMVWYGTAWHGIVWYGTFVWLGKKKGWALHRNLRACVRACVCAVGWPETQKEILGCAVPLERVLEHTPQERGHYFYSEK